MVRMSTVWDRSTQVMAGRFGMLATIAGLLGVVPAVVQQVFFLSRTGGTAAPLTAADLAAFGGGMALVGLLVGVCALWNGLSLVAAASNPGITGAGQAMAAGLRRLPVLIGLSLLLVLLLAVLAVPAFALLGLGIGRLAGGVSPFQAGYAAGSVGAVSPGALLGFGLYSLVLFVLFVWLSARLILLNPVIVNERRGFGSFARSFELTRGLALRIVGVLILFGIVFLVLSFAVQAVVGVVLSLLFGVGSKLAVFLTAIVSACVGAALTIVFTTFTAQLYRSVTGLEAAETFG